MVDIRCIGVGIDKKVIVKQKRYFVRKGSWRWLLELKEVKSYTTYVICDDCGKEMILCTTFNPPSFDTKMNGALLLGYTFKDIGKQFKNYCNDCKEKHK
ncbi:hypothetical protein ACT7DZ_10390 [Bacillus cereus]